MAGSLILGVIVVTSVMVPSYKTVDSLLASLPLGVVNIMIHSRLGVLNNVIVLIFWKAWGHKKPASPALILVHSFLKTK